MRSIFSKISIKISVPLILTVPVLIVVVVLSLVAFTHSRSAVNDLANQNMDQIHSRIEEHLSQLMDTPPAANALIKRMLATGELSLVDVARNRAPVYEALKIFPDVACTLVCSASGESMWVIRYPGEPYELAVKIAPRANMKEYTLGDHGQIISECVSEYAWFPTVRPWYIDAVEAGGPTWGRVYVWLRHGKAVTLGLPYTEPVRDDEGNVAGVIISEMSLAGISMHLQRLQIGKTGKAFIIERSGDLVATSVGITCMKDGVERLPAVESSDTWITQASTELASHFGSPETIAERSRIETHIDGEPMRLVVSPYTNRRNLDWLIVTLVPERDFMAEIEAGRRRSVAISLVAVASTVALGIVLALAMVRPFLSLVAQLRQIGGGDLKHEVHLNQAPEFAQVSGEVNKMVAGLRDRMQMRHSLAVAMEVQQNLLPSDTPKVEGLDVAGHSTYCDETGGDYYDYLDVAGLSETTIAIALGDVMGHGVAAAMLMATARGILRSRCGEVGSLAELLTYLNGHLAKDVGIDTGRFMTMLLATIDAERKEMRWASAGHDMPLVYDSDSDSFMELDGGGLPLGVMGDTTYEEYVFSNMRSGQVLVASTDGVWETQDSQGEMFGKERLCDLIQRNAHLSAADISALVREKLRDFRGEGTQNDDITYVVVKIL